LTELTNLEWTEAGVFGPYSTSGPIKESLNITSRFSLLGIDVPESRFLLILVNEDKVVERIYLSREHPDYHITREYKDFHLQENKILVFE